MNRRPSHPRAVYAAALVVAAAAFMAPAHAQRFSATSQVSSSAASVVLATWSCTRGDGKACTAAERTGADYKQILIVPTGYTEADRAAFFDDADRMRRSMSDIATPVYSSTHKGRILYITYWVAGGALASGQSTFGGKVFAHPVRGKALTMNQEAAYAFVTTRQLGDLPWLRPSAVAALFNTYENGITANATPPSYTRRAYGIARFTAGDVRGQYIAAHELGHAMLSWVDEYVESGFESTNITQFDALTPLVVWDGTFRTLGSAVGNLLGVYSIRISEVLASNGADNVATTQYPGTVSQSAPGSERYEYEGGMFFGRGTWHDAGSNLMNGSHVMRGADDTFAYAHSPAQQRLVDTAFGNGQARRANDRLRNAGPVNGWPLEFGSSTTVMMFDADKNHRWQPTQSYEVQVGWWERTWKTCWAAFIPYPCYSDKWLTAQKSIAPTTNYIELKSSAGYGLAGFLQRLVCGIGLGGLTGGIDICTLSVDLMSSAFVPTLRFFLPYQSTAVPASQWLTTYYWRFRTWNGTHWSGQTSWSSFYRSL